VCPHQFTFFSKHANGKEAVALHTGYKVCIVSTCILYFGALHDGKQAGVVQLQWHKWHLFPL
jgi:hypothetical protein